MQVWPLGWEDPLEEGMATHSSILAWRLPWTEEPGGLRSTGPQGSGHDWSDLAHTHRLENSVSLVVPLGLRCSMACGVLQDQGLNPCLLHWQVDSSPLSQQGSPILCFWETTILFFTVAAPVFFPISSAWVFQLLHTLKNASYFPFKNLILKPS